MSVRRYGVRPHPGPDESLVGYTLRIANVNGLHSLDFMLMSMGMDRGSHKRLLKGVPAVVSKTIDYLALYLGRNSEDIRATFTRMNTTAYGYDNERMIKQIGVDFPRVCPDCVVDSGRLDWRWGLAVVARCPSHGSLLVDACPACSKPLEWKTKLFEGCPHCGHKWADKSGQGSERVVSPHEASLWRALGECDVSPDPIRDTAAAIVTMARPYDSWHSAIQTAPYSPQYSKLVDVAHRVLSNDMPILMQWSQAINELRQELITIGQRAVELPMYNLVSEASCRPPAVPLPVEQGPPVRDDPLGEHLVFVSNARRCLIKRDERKLRYQASHREIAFVLQMQSTEVQFLIDEGPLRPINSTSIMASQIFDLRDLVALTERNTRRTLLSQPTVIEHKDSRLSEHFTRYGKLVAAVLAGKLPGQYSLLDGFDKVVVESAPFEAWLVEQRELACQQPLTLHRVMAALKCSEKTICNLVREGHFQWARWATAGGRDRVDGPSLLSYLTTTPS